MYFNARISLFNFVRKIMAVLKVAEHRTIYCQISVNILIVTSSVLDLSVYYCFIHPFCNFISVIAYIISGYCNINITLN